MRSKSSSQRAALHLFFDICLRLGNLEQTRQLGLGVFQVVSFIQY